MIKILENTKKLFVFQSLCSSLEVFINCNTNRHFLYLKKKYLNIETIFQEMNKEKILLSI